MILTIISKIRFNSYKMLEWYIVICPFLNAFRDKMPKNSSQSDKQDYPIVNGLTKNNKK